MLEPHLCQCVISECANEEVTSPSAEKTVVSTTPNIMLQKATQNGRIRNEDGIESSENFPLLPLALRHHILTTM